MSQEIVKELTKAVSTFDHVKLLQTLAAIILTVIALIFLSIAFKNFKARTRVSDDVKKLHIFTTAYRTVKVLIVLTAILCVLQINGVNVSYITISMGVLAAVALLAVKDSFQDIFSGFTIMLDKYFSVGDAVEYEGREGIVVSFTVLSTQIELLDDRSVLAVANRHVTKIRRLTHLADIDLPLSYKLDAKKAYEVLKGICERIEQTEGVESCELKGTQEFTENSVVYKIRFFCDPAERPDIRRAAMKIIQDGLAENGITIPHRQLDVHMMRE